MSQDNHYVIISPVRDEARYVARTLESVTRQSVLPQRWIIVDDGSKDQTPEIVADYARRFTWITLISRDRSGVRKPGAGVVNVFNLGLEALGDQDYDFVIKLDCDLDLPQNYFEELLNRFQSDPRLGIASGVYLERRMASGGWSVFQMPHYHAAGPAKMIRRQCFAEIEGFVPCRGWDTIDEIRAQMKGWTTRNFPELEFYHLKSQGSGIGHLRTFFDYGEGHYRLGGGLVFFAVKSLQRAVKGWPPVLGALWMVAGYVSAAVRRKPLLVSPAEAQHYRDLLNSRITRGTSRFLSLRRSPELESCFRTANSNTAEPAFEGSGRLQPPPG